MLPSQDPIPTRYSLLSRLENWEDWGSWKMFFDTYWRLIYSAAIKSGLTETEAQDVVQETIISVAHDIHKFKRDRGRGSFKGWLRNLTRWRVADQLRKRVRAQGGTVADVAAEREAFEAGEIADPAASALEAAWDEEWQANLMSVAVERVRNQVKEEHYQMFDLYVVKGLPVKKVAEILGVSAGHVYLAKHRVAALIKKEIHKLEKKEYLKHPCGKAMTEPASNEMPDAKPPESNALPIVSDHKLIRIIGEGSGGKVWLATNVLGTYRAIKIVRASHGNRNPLEHELKGILKYEPVSRLHDGLVDVLQVGYDREAGYFYYVMELADDAVSGRTFDPQHYVPRTLALDQTRHRRLPIGECVRLGAAIASALGFLHRHGLIHRDIKPSNIIFVNGFPKLADIGLMVGMSEESSYIGTEGFIPAEGAGTVHADIYSFGKVLYELSTGLDRLKYPELPADLGMNPEDRDLVQFNKIVVKACRKVPVRRFKSAEHMMSAILSFQFNASEGRKYETRRFRSYVLGRIGAVVGSIIAVGVVSLLLWRIIWLLKQP